MSIVTNCELRPYGPMSRSNRDVAERLEITQQALGLSAADLCRRSGIKQNAWSQFLKPEKKRPITRAAALKLKDEFRITLDWIYDGDASNLPAALAQQIRAIQNQRAKKLSA